MLDIQLLYNQTREATYGGNTMLLLETKQQCKSNKARLSYPIVN